MDAASWQPRDDVDVLIHDAMHDMNETDTGGPEVSGSGERIRSRRKVDAALASLLHGTVLADDPRLSSGATRRRQLLRASLEGTPLCLRHEQQHKQEGGGVDDCKRGEAPRLADGVGEAEERADHGVVGNPVLRAK